MAIAECIGTVIWSGAVGAVAGSVCPKSADRAHGLAGRALFQHRQARGLDLADLVADGEAFQPMLRRLAEEGDLLLAVVAQLRHPAVQIVDRALAVLVAERDWLLSLLLWRNGSSRGG